MRTLERLIDVLRTLNPRVVGPHVVELATEAADTLARQVTFTMPLLLHSRLSSDYPACIVTDTIMRSRQIIDALQMNPALGPPDWYPRTFFDAGTGRRWSTIVAFRPDLGWTPTHQLWVDEVLRTKSNDVRLIG